MLSAIDIANRALERERWAREKLAGYAGRAVCVNIGPVGRAFAIDADGRLHDSEAAPDLKLSISALRLPALLAQPERWSELVNAEGDRALAATLSELALTLPWFVEQMLANAFGPIMGQRMADIGRHLLAFPDHGARRFADSVSRYIGEEAQLVVGAAEARVAASEIAALDTRLEALSARIEVLDHTMRDAPAPPLPKDATRT